LRSFGGADGAKIDLENGRKLKSGGHLEKLCEKLHEFTRQSVDPVFFFD